jgi:FKBP-type peptidyl-prolyl cis-trans isomerase 2
VAQETINEGDCTYISFIGRVKADGRVFSTTNEDIAKKNNIYNKNYHYGPLFVMIGKGGLMHGLEKRLIGKSIGEKYTVLVPSSEGFGRRDPKKIESISLRRLKQAGIKPVRGATVLFRDRYGIIVAIESGMAKVDFNHELAGKDLEFEVQIEKVVQEFEKKIDGLIELHFPSLKIEDRKFSFNLEQGTLLIDFPFAYLLNPNNGARVFQFFNDIVAMFKEKVKRLEFKYSFALEEAHKILTPSSEKLEENKETDIGSIEMANSEQSSKEDASSPIS